MLLCMKLALYNSMTAKQKNKKYIKDLTKDLKVYRLLCITNYKINNLFDAKKYYYVKSN